MTDRLSEDDLARLDKLIVYAHDYGGTVQELGDLARALVAEVRAHRAREASGVPTDEMVEVGARALNAEGWTCYQGEDEPGRYDDCEDCRRVCAGPARTVLVAALEARTT